MTDIRDASYVAKASDGTIVRRPMSPHLGVYRWQITMVSSILNRATGIALSVGTLLLVWWLLAAAAGPKPFALVQEFLISPIGLFLLLGWTVALFYHFFAGIRHLTWDVGYGFEKRNLNIISWATIACTLVASALVWAIAYARLGG